MKRILAHIIRIILIVNIIFDVWSIIEKIKWYKNPTPGLSEMINIKVCILWIIICGIGVLLTSIYLKKTPR